MRGREIVAESEVRRSQSFQRLVSDSTLLYPRKALAQVLHSPQVLVKATPVALWLPRMLPSQSAAHISWCSQAATLPETSRPRCSCRILRTSPRPAGTADSWGGAGRVIRLQNKRERQAFPDSKRWGSLSICGRFRRTPLLLKSSQSGLRQAAANSC